MDRIDTAHRLSLTAATGADCTSLADVREALDRIDAEVISLLAMRLDYVKNATRFKPDYTSIPAPDRVGHMLAERTQWAETEGLDPNFITPLFAQIIQWNIQQQMAHWKTRAR